MKHPSYHTSLAQQEDTSLKILQRLKKKQQLNKLFEAFHLETDYGEDNSNFMLLEAILIVWTAAHISLTMTGNGLLFSSLMLCWKL